MRNVWRIFRDDLRLANGSVVAMLVVLALCLAPALFAWVSVAGSWNPSNNAGQLKVAVANSDYGYESSLMPTRLNVGDRVVGVLRDNDDYGWVFVDERTALDGVNSGEYYAAITIPKDFSSKTMASLSSESEQVSVGFYLNTKISPVASILAGEGGSSVEEGIRNSFTKAVDDMSLELAADFVSFAGGNNAREFGVRLVAHLDAAANSLDATADQIRSFAILAEGASSLTSAADEALLGSEDVAGATGKVVSGASESLNAAVDSAQSAAASIRQQVQAAQDVGSLGSVGTETASRLATDVASLASSVDSIAHEAESVSVSFEKTATSLSTSTKSVESSLSAVRNQLGIAANKLNASSAKVRKFQEDVASAIAKGDLSTVATIVGGRGALLARWVAQPVRIEEQTVNPLENYGSSIAPFFTAFSLWIGVVLMMLVLKTRVSRGRLDRYEEKGEERSRPVRGFERYLGRYLVFAVVALVQATIVALGDLLFLRIQCANPLLFFVACWVCALAFSCLAYTLCALFGNVGKALCIVVLVLQVVGGSGVFPAQLLGDLYPVASLLLPVTHGAHALQASVVGLYDMEYAYDLLRLAAFFLPSLILGLALNGVLNKDRSSAEEKGDGTAEAKHGAHAS